MDINNNSSTHLPLTNSEEQSSLSYNNQISILKEFVKIESAIKPKSMS